MNWLWKLLSRTCFCHKNQITEYNIPVMCYHQMNSCSISSETSTCSQWTSMWVLFNSSTTFTRQPFWCICLPNLSGIWIQSQSYTSMWSEKKAILESMANLVNNIWSHQYHDVLFCWRYNYEDCAGEVVGPLFSWTDLNETVN